MTGMDALFDRGSVCDPAGQQRPLLFCYAGLVAWRHGALNDCALVDALRQGAVMPRDLVDAIVKGKPLVGGNHSVLARIVDFSQEHQKDEEAVKAFAA